MQHHDAVSGTHPVNTGKDYVDRMEKSKRSGTTMNGRIINDYIEPLGIKVTSYITICNQPNATVRCFI